MSNEPGAPPPEPGDTPDPSSGRPPGDGNRPAAPPPEQVDDPVRQRRAQIARWTLLANRVGYLFVGLALALFFIAFALGFTATMATLILAALIIGCVLLAPSIILGYAVKAAERDDVERGI